MRINLSTILAAASLVTFGGVQSVQAASLASRTSLSGRLSKSNHYGAPVAPWKSGHQPGWYYGTQPNLLGEYGDIPYLGDSKTCESLNSYSGCLHCPKSKPPPPPPKNPYHHKHHSSVAPPPPPPPPSNFTQTIYNVSCAVQADDYMTFGLVDTIEDCEAMCESVEGCTFINTYHDVNGKNGSPLLTCALFSLCHTAASADNCGGQSQPDGTIDFITNSDGFCYTGGGGVLPSGFSSSVASPTKTPTPTSTYHAKPTPTYYKGEGYY